MKSVLPLNRSLVVLATVLALMVAGLPVGHAVAQEQATTYTSAVTGSVIRTSGPWLVEIENSEVAEDMEFITVQGELEFMQIAWLPGSIDLVTARDLLLHEFTNVFDTFVEVDRGAYGNVSYSLDLTHLDDVDFGVFTLFLGERANGYVEAYTFFGAVPLFANGISSAQEHVTVNGNPVFKGIEGAGLQSHLEQHGGATGGAPVEPAPDESTALSPAPTEAPPQPTVPAAPSEPVATEGDEAGYLNSIRGELEYLNLSIGEFVINFGGLQGDDPDTAVEEINRISEEWLWYTERAESIVAPAGFEEIDATYRALANDVETMGMSWRAYVSAMQAGTDTDEAVDAFLADMKTVQQGIEDVGGMLDARASSGDDPAQVETPAPSEPTATEVVAPTEESIASSGPGKGSLGGIVKGGNTPAAGGRQAGGTGGYADLGLVEDGAFVSPQTGVEITWDETWYFDDAYDKPISSNPESGLDEVTISWVADSTVSIFVVVGPAAGLQPVEFADLWSSDEYLLENAAPAAEVLATGMGRSGGISVVIRDYLDDGTEVVIMRSATCADSSCEHLVVTTMIGLPGSFADAYADARRDITVEGMRLFDALTPREISAALDG